MKDDFRKEVAFFDIIGNTISCGWCKLVYSSQKLKAHKTQTSLVFYVLLLFDLLVKDKLFGIGLE